MDFPGVPILQRIKTFYAGLLGGAVAGAIITLILTPSSGQKLREQSRQHLQDLLLESAHAADERREQLRQQLASMTSLEEN
jgi:gas vesicle protein